MKGDARIPLQPAAGDDERRREYNQILESLAIIRSRSRLLREWLDQDRVDERELMHGLGEIDRQTRVIDAVLSHAIERNPDE